MTTCPTADSAQALATGAVERGLAACVQVLPGLVSTYRWQGAVQHDDEVLVVLKVATASLPALHAWVTAQHPYEVPQWVVLSAQQVSEAYGAWALQQCGLAG